MHYTRMGDSGLIVSRLCLGTMTFGPDPSIPSVYKVDRAAAEAMLARALDAGINFIDTADAYAGGQSEEILGAALGARRKDVVIVTKVGFRTGSPITQAGLSRRHILASCEESLRRLRTDYIDLYIAHKEDPVTPLDETLAAFQDLIRAGKVRYVGFSNWSAWRAATALQMQRANHWAPFVCGQFYYSLVGREVEYELVPLLRWAGVGMMVWSPLAGGFLSGKYSRASLTDKQNRLSGFDLLPFDKEEGFRIVERVRAVAERRGASVVQVALAWLLTRPTVASVLIGASKLAQLEDNRGAIDVQLTREDLEELDAATARPSPYPQWFNASLIDPQHKQMLLEQVPGAPRS